MREEEAKVGWRGLVAMVKWWGAPIMIVMEPLEVYHLQQELSTSMSYGQVRRGVVAAAAAAPRPSFVRVVLVRAGRQAEARGGVAC